MTIPGRPVAVCLGLVAMRGEARGVCSGARAVCFESPPMRFVALALMRGALGLVNGPLSLVIGPMAVVYGPLAVCFLSLPRLFYGWTPWRGLWAFAREGGWMVRRALARAHRHKARKRVGRAVAREVWRVAREPLPA